MNFEHFVQACEDAPEGVFEQAKDVRYLIGGIAEELLSRVRGLALKANNCDGIYAVEKSIYRWIVESNPDDSLFHSAEGFGEAVKGEARHRVLAAAIKGRDFLRDADTFPGEIG